MNKTAGNQHLHFTVETWTNDLNIPNSEKKYKIKTITDNVFPFLDMDMILSSNEDMQFGLYRKKVQKLK